MKHTILESLGTLRERERELYFSENKNSLRRILNLKLEGVKEQKGITLMALVITIIVLLILAGITIGMLIGDNGIINNAGNAKGKRIYANSIFWRDILW